MQNFNVELFSRLFFLNLAKSFKIDENFSVVSGRASPSASGQGALEPPTPPRTPIIAAQKSAEKNYNNNNDDGKENFEGNSSISRDYDEFSRRFHDESNCSDGGRESVVSGSMQNGNNDDSDRESDCASSFDSSKLSMKNIENFLDKSPMVRKCFFFLIFLKFSTNFNLSTELLQPNDAPQQHIAERPGRETVDW